MCVCLYLSFSKDWGGCRTCQIVAYWPLCVFQSRWRWRRLFPRDSGLSAPFALPLCYPGSIPARCLWQWGGCLALPCQPDVVRYRRLLCCLHVPRVLPTLSGKYIHFFCISDWQSCSVLLHLCSCLLVNVLIKIILSFIEPHALVLYRTFRKNLAPSHMRLFAFSGRDSSEWVTSSSAPWRSWRLAHNVPLCCWTQRRWGCLIKLKYDVAETFCNNSAACYAFECVSFNYVYVMYYVCIGWCCGLMCVVTCLSLAAGLLWAAGDSEV